MKHTKSFNFNLLLIFIGVVISTIGVVSNAVQHNAIIDFSWYGAATLIGMCICFHASCNIAKKWQDEAA